MRTFAIVITTLALIFQSCEQKEGVNISGQYIGDIGDGMVYLELIKDDTKAVIDSFYLDPNGNFDRGIQVEEPAFYRINFNNRNIVNVILNDTDITITAPKEGTRYTVKGSADTDYMTNVNELKSKFGQEIQALNAQFMQARNTGDETRMIMLQEEYLTRQKAFTNQLKSEIWKMDNSIAGILSINFLENPEAEFSFLDSLANKYAEQLPNSSYTNGLLDKVNSLRKLAIGSDAPEIELPDPEGKKIKLSSLRGSYVLIDFWAAWCRPCRMENPNVVKMYERYHAKGFEILGVSLDRKKEDWLKAIENDGLTWRHVSDLRYFQSEAAQTYQINAIPATYLIGPDGKILAKNLRGAALETKLREIFG